MTSTSDSTTSARFAAEPIKTLLSTFALLYALTSSSVVLAEEYQKMPTPDGVFGGGVIPVFKYPLSNIDALTACKQNAPGVYPDTASDITPVTASDGMPQVRIKCSYTYNPNLYQGTITLNLLARCPS